MPWQPLNKYCWDFWFANAGQTLHVFYLQAAKLACAYNATRRHNLASVGHAVLTDFGWQEISTSEPALSRREGNYWDNLSIWTCSIIEKDGCYYMFYTARCTFDSFVQTNYELRQPQNIGVVESQDLIAWQRTTKSKEKPVIPNPGLGSEFDGVSWRDPYVIKDDIDGQFYAFICACPIDAPVDAGGAVAYATSLDLEDWQSEPYRILYKSPEFHYLEVPQVFWRKIQDCWRLYLLFSPHWSRYFERREPRGTYYVRSKEDGIYYLFYSGGGNEGIHLQNQAIGLATSIDGQHFFRCSNNYLLQPSDDDPWYGRWDLSGHFHWRDPYIFKDDKTGNYYMFICASAKTVGNFQGCIGLAVADKISGPYKLLTPAVEVPVGVADEWPFYHMERPQVIYKGGKYHLFFSCFKMFMNPKGCKK